MTAPAVHCEGLCKRYGVHEALRGLDLAVPAGTLFGLLGPNGAGKSTTLRILSGLVRADRGRARLFGVDARDHVRAARRTAFLIENAVFPPQLTARAVLERSAAWAGVRDDARALLARVGLDAAARRRTGGFSHGMRQRLGLACALVGAPDLLVLDEPQNGLDPAGLRRIRTILREEHERGATVLVSVHRLAEVEGLCTHAALLVEGRVARAGAVTELLEGERPRYRLRTSDAARARAVLAQMLDGTPVERHEDGWAFEADEELASRAAAACVRDGQHVFELAPLRSTLDDLYLREVGA